MEKINVDFHDYKEMEFYCPRNDFGYNCNYTPNNCTECPITRASYHILTTDILAEESANKLKKLADESQAFSGKYDGSTALPPDVWDAIYAIREVYYWCTITRGPRLRYITDLIAHEINVYIYKNFYEK